VFYIDSDKCTGCGACVDACPRRAISIHGSLAMINQELCSQCGICTRVCPIGAVNEIAPVYAAAGEGQTYSKPLSMLPGSTGIATGWPPNYRGYRPRPGGGGRRRRRECRG
jgi:MinD superfamily P-loop ATPase